jgi:threonine efflux protein
MSPEFLALFGFAVVMAIGQFSPGPDMLWLTRVALRDGRRAGIRTAIGIACGLAVHATLALTGLALLLHRHASLRMAFALAAAGYLGWLAIRILREPGVVADGGAAARPGRPFLRGLLCNLANPKVAIFIAAVSTPFLESARSPWLALGLWIIIVFQGGALWVLWANFLQIQRVRKIYHAQARRIDLAFAITLAGLAMWLVVAVVR